MNLDPIMSRIVNYVLAVTALLWAFAWLGTHVDRQDWKARAMAADARYERCVTTVSGASAAVAQLGEDWARWNEQYSHIIGGAR